MKIPSKIFDHKIWTLVGPMGPKLEDSTLLSHPIICVDGGAHYCPKALIWIGDSDSNQIKINAEYSFDLNPKKDFSDLKAAFDLFPENSSHELHLWGFLGGREDHHLINLGETYRFIDQHQGSWAYFYDSRGKVTMMVAPSGNYKINHQGRFSVMAFSPTNVLLKGNCEYQILSPTTLEPLSSRGLSNQANGEIEVQSNLPLLIILEGHSP